MKQDSKIFIAGHQGLLGSALSRVLKQKNYTNLLTLARSETDYADFNKLESFFESQQPEYVFLAAGKTGGILANKTSPADFLQKNVLIQSHFFHLSQKYGVKTLVFFSSSCVYPKEAAQPIAESTLMTGPIEPTSQAYAAAKLAGMYACQAYNIQHPETQMICLLPNSIYGPFDNFSLENSHVLGALMRKIHDAHRSGQTSLTLWGSGRPYREFIFSEDVAEAAVFAVANRAQLQNHHYNVGTGKEYSIKELANMISEVIGYEGKILFDSTQPDGTPRKLLDSRQLNQLGWSSTIDLKKGIEVTYEWFRQKYSAAKI